MEVNSVIGMLELLKAIRKTAIRDELVYKRRGTRKGKNAWVEWKQSQCRYIYYNCFVLVYEIDNYKSRPIIIPRNGGSIEY